MIRCIFVRGISRLPPNSAPALVLSHCFLLSTDLSDLDGLRSESCATLNIHPRATFDFTDTRISHNHVIIISRWDPLALTVAVKKIIPYPLAVNLIRSTSSLHCLTVSWLLFVACSVGSHHHSYTTIHTLTHSPSPCTLNPHSSKSLPKSAPSSTPTSSTPAVTTSSKSEANGPQNYLTASSAHSTTSKDHPSVAASPKPPTTAKIVHPQFTRQLSPSIENFVTKPPTTSTPSMHSHLSVALKPSRHS